MSLADVSLADRTPQHELHDFLQSELYHTLGSYGTVVQRLRSLDERMKARDGASPWGTLFPREAVGRMREFNESLRGGLHKPAVLRTDPSALHAAKKPAQHPYPGESLGGEDVRYQWVLDFYASAVRALAHVEASPQDKTSPDGRLGHALAIVHDAQRRPVDPETIDKALVRGRVYRNERRLRLARQVIGWAPSDDRADAILDDHLGVGSGVPLHTHALGALVEAHMRMHRAEHLLTHSFGDKIRHSAEIHRTVRDELTRSLMLNTFVYVVGRTVPWIFAENEEERDYVIDNYAYCCDALTPTYCTWIANQVSLLALHRRAFTWLLRGNADKAHNDFHKLKRTIRSLEHRLDQRVLHAPGAQTFLHGLTAFADHHSGTIYRRQHAHTAALRHFDRAASRLARLAQDPELRGMLRNSRWRIHLLISQGKASYERGSVKHSLSCYVRAWHAFLELADTENSARANFKVVDDVLEWLDEVEPDAEVNKVELHRRIAPLVAQLPMVRSPTHLRVLAAEIMLRLAHVLFMLKLPLSNGREVERAPGGEPLTDHDLAWRCLLQAAELDQSQTLIASDLLKFERSDDAKVPEHDLDREMEPIDGQWPGGGSQFEEAARVVEYVLQSWLNAIESDADTTPIAPERPIARQLLTSFLIHTDSTNVKLAQVYRYLMQPPTPSIAEDMPSSEDGPSLELVCLRRYSSFFPFLPRPSAFRVLGGGYFLRIESGETPFGIVIDPGPNFLDNLYSCGYCLADVHMVLVTHDHADHIAALDPLLALLGYRERLLAKTFTEDRKLVIVGNESVKRRYEFFNSPEDDGAAAAAKAPAAGGPAAPQDKPKRADPVSVWTFSEWDEAVNGSGATPGTRPIDDLLQPPRTLRIEPVKTYAHTDASGTVAQGVMISVGEGGRRSSILFMSDTGPAPDMRLAATTRTPSASPASHGKPLAEAIAEATVVVAHVSAIPLPELRRLAGLGRPPAKAAAHMRAFEKLWDALCAQIEAMEEKDPHWSVENTFLLRQVQFGFHSLPKRKIEDTPEGLRVWPLSPHDDIREPSERHLYLDGLLAVARQMLHNDRERLLLIGEMREELGTFRTRIAGALNEHMFKRGAIRALTTDIGLRVRIRPAGERPHIEVLCTTCDLDNDLADEERYHAPAAICEVCVKGEDEGIFYNCTVHDPQRQAEPTWVERVERYAPFGR